MFVAAYLIVLAFSAINIQHDILNNDAREQVQFSSHHFKIPEITNHDSLSSAIMDSLDLFGYAPWWQRSMDDAAGLYTFNAQRPGRKYKIEAWLKEDSVVQQTTRLGIGSIVDGLHYGTGGNPVSSAFTFWGFYGETSMILLFIMLISNIYFWLKKSVSGYQQWLVVFVAGLFSIILMLYLWQVG